MNRIDLMQKMLKERKLDAFVVFTYEDTNKNLLYLTGFGGTAGVLVITPKKSVLMVDGRYLLRARKETRDIEILRVQGTRNILGSVLEGLSHLKAQGINRVGYEGRQVSVLMAEEWKKSFKGELVPTERIVEQLRKRKDASEIKSIKRACGIVDAVYKEIAAWIKPGLRESDVAAEIDYFMRKHGAIGPSFPAIIASGPNAALPHHATGDRKLKAGDIVIMDFGAQLSDGYCSDITRTIFVSGEKPHSELFKIYRIVLEANKAAFKGLKVGMKFKEYDAIARDYIKERGYGDKFIHSLGHSLGLDVHDYYDYANDPILEGTVLTDEPGIYIEGLGGVRIEDDLLMTKKGPIRLTKAPYLK